MAFGSPQYSYHLFSVLKAIFVTLLKSAPESRVTKRIYHLVRLVSDLIRIIQAHRFVNRAICLHLWVWMSVLIAQKFAGGFYMSHDGISNPLCRRFIAFHLSLLPAAHRLLLEKYHSAISLYWGKFSFRIMPYIEYILISRFDCPFYQG